MKKAMEFLKTTALGGFFVLLPVLLLYLLLDEALGLVLALATPIADLFPEGTFDEINFPLLIAAFLIMFVSFLTGLAMRSELGRRVGHWIERTTLNRLPGYTALKNLTTGFTKTGEANAFRPAVLVSPDGDRELAYVVDEYGNGQVTILLPWSPTPFAGSIKIVKQDRVELLDTDLGDFTKVLSHWGVGVSDLLDKSSSRADLPGGSQQ